MNGNMRRPGQGRPAGGARPAPRSGAPSVSGRRPTAGNGGGRPPMRRGINKWLIVGAIAVLVIVVIIIAVAAGSGKKSPNKPVILPYDTGGTGGPAETEPAGAPPLQEPKYVRKSKVYLAGEFAVPQPHRTAALAGHGESSRHPRPMPPRAPTHPVRCYDLIPYS